ncbi:VWA domain-containing protein [bacterium]|nr:VWA domain-containing protein [bacterium]MBQ4437868.1 VWA domain-containing protein [bacterium]
MMFYNWKILLSAVVWVPIVIAAIVYCTKKRNDFMRFFDKTQAKKAVFAGRKTFVIKRILIFTALLLFTVAAARPMTGGEEVNTNSTGIDIAVVFDVSLSMFAEDENGARFEKGKMMLIDVLNSLSGDRVAIIPFAGAAFLQLPLTDDYETLQTVVSVLEPGMIERQGTALGTAIELAADTLKSSPETSDKMIIIISDGEDPSLDFGKMKERIEKENIHLALLPLGTEDGAPVKIGDSYLKDKLNQTVISKIDKGFFDKCISVLGAVEIKKGDTLSSYIKNFKKSSRGENRIVNIYKERFQIPLFFGLIAFFVYYLFSFAKRGEKHEK